MQETLLTTLLVGAEFREKKMKVNWQTIANAVADRMKMKRIAMP